VSKIVSSIENLNLMVEQALRCRFRGETSEQIALIEALTNMISDCRLKGWNDKNVIKGLCSSDTSKYRQSLSEVLLFHLLSAQGFTPICSTNGPDFVIEKHGKKIWIEVITPEPKGLPDDWCSGAMGKAITVPNDEILLRWTNAIDEKTKKLNGRFEPRTGEFRPGYLQKKIVGPNDSYVIAINGIDLRWHWVFPNLNGISQYPFAVEAVFGIGPIQIHIDRKTLTATHSDQQIRDSIPKRVDQNVPVGTFISSGPFTQNEFKRVSAIWALDIDEMYSLGHERPMVVVHNPLAEFPIEEKLLPAFEEYVCIAQANEWQLTRKPGVRKSASKDVENDAI